MLAADDAELAEAIDDDAGEQTRRTLNQAPTTPVLEYQDHQYSWGDMRAVADKVGSLLVEAGLTRAVPVAFVPRNRASAVAAELGLVASGFTIRMVHAFQAPVGIARDIGRAEVATVVAAAEDFTPELLDVLRKQGLAAVQLGDMTGRSSRPSSDGVPPVVMAFPLGNITGVYGTLPPLLKGFRAILADRFSLNGWCDYQRRFKSVTAGLPSAGIRTITDAGIPKQELVHLKALISGAAPLDPGVQRAFEEHYGISILLVYGATKFGGPVAQWDLALYQQYGQEKFGSVGKPYGGAKIRIVDPASGEEVPHDTEGLMEVISPRVGDHWIRATDLGRIDFNGFIYHLGRADGAIMRGGVKLVPEVIERALLLHPDLAAVAVVGIPDPRLGEVPVAAIQTKPGHPVSDAVTLEANLREHVYATHVPVDWCFVDALPRNLSVKIARARMDERAKLLMTVPGVGALISLTFVAAIDDPQRFGSSRTVGAHLGLTQRKY